jgi:hypothetical protein
MELLLLPEEVTPLPFLRKLKDLLKSFLMSVLEEVPH